MTNDQNKRMLELLENQEKARKDEERRIRMAEVSAGIIGTCVFIGNQIQRSKEKKIERRNLKALKDASAMELFGTIDLNKYHLHFVRWDDEQGRYVYKERFARMEENHQRKKQYSEEQAALVRQQQEARQQNDDIETAPVVAKPKTIRIVDPSQEKREVNRVNSLDAIRQASARFKNMD
jgi:hypothetical protein